MKTKYLNELLFDSVANGDVEAVRFALDRGADAVARAEYDSTKLSTPLHVASCNNHVDIAALIIERGGYLDARDETGSTPLHCAGGSDMAALLLLHGANINAADDAGETLLHSVACAHDAEMVALLVEHGARHLISGAEGKSPMELAEMESAWDGEDEARLQTIESLKIPIVPEAALAE
jgi:ankyrin repeat protein